MDGKGRGRLRLEAVDRENLPDGSYRVTVVLEGGGRHVRGFASGVGRIEAEYRTAAAATLDAVDRASGGRLGVRLRGIKAVRVFDGLVAIASVGARGADGERALIGTCVADAEEPAHSAARAVLDAVNRVLEWDGVGEEDSKAPG